MGFVIAIDGPAAAGKGTLSKAIALHFGFEHLDTGLLYRAVAARVLLGEEASHVAQNLQPSDLGRPNLRTHDVAQAASRVAVDPLVRSALVKFQRDFAKLEPGAVLDGRDIGTVICPDASLKLFVTASVECRARRRYDELCLRGDDVSYEQVFEDMSVRDERDRTRSEAPLCAAQDAVLLDTSELSAQQVLELSVAFVDKLLKP